MLRGSIPYCPHKNYGQEKIGSNSRYGSLVELSNNVSENLGFSISLARLIRRIHWRRDAHCTDAY